MAPGEHQAGLLLILETVTQSTHPDFATLHTAERADCPGWHGQRASGCTMRPFRAALDLGVAAGMAHRALGGAGECGLAL